MRRALGTAALIVPLILLALLFGVARISASDNSTVAQNAQQSITAHGTCAKVANNNASGLSVYVPTQSAAEWQSFRDHPPVGVSLSSCVTPGSQSYAVPGTYSFTIPPYNTLTLEMQGSGGGGAGWARNNVGPQGGGGGAFVRKTFQAGELVVGSSARVVLGIPGSAPAKSVCDTTIPRTGTSAGGTAAAASFTVTGSDRYVYIFAGGGRGGQFASVDGGGGQGPNGGTANFGDVNIPGQSGGLWPNPYGGASPSAGSAAPGQDGLSPGGGGGGGSGECSTVGDGGIGYITITWN